MAFDVNEFKAVIGQRGIQRNNHFAVNFAPPSAVQIPGLINDLPILCNTVNLPGFNISADDIRHKGYGLTEKRPSQVSFEDITLTIIADSKGEVLDFVHSWFRLVFPHGNTEDSSNVEFFGYPMDYYGELEIYMYDVTSEKHTTYRIHQCYPLNMSALTMSWSDMDSTMIIPISFAYRNYDKNESYSGSSMFLSNGNVRNSSVVDRLLTSSNPFTEYAQQWI